MLAAVVALPAVDAALRSLGGSPAVAALRIAAPAGPAAAAAGIECRGSCWLRAAALLVSSAWYQAFLRPRGDHRCQLQKDAWEQVAPRALAAVVSQVATGRLLLSSAAAGSLPYAGLPTFWRGRPGLLAADADVAAAAAGAGLPCHLRATEDVAALAGAARGAAAASAVAAGASAAVPAALE